MLQFLGWVRFYCLSQLIPRSLWGFNLQMKTVGLREVRSSALPSHTANKWQRSDLNQGSQTWKFAHSPSNPELHLPLSCLLLQDSTLPLNSSHKRRGGGGGTWGTLWMFLYNVCKANKGYFYHLPQVPPWAIIVLFCLSLRVSRIKHEYYSGSKINIGPWKPWYGLDSSPLPGSLRGIKGSTWRKKSMANSGYCSVAKAMV